MNHPESTEDALREAEKAFAEGNYALVRERALDLEKRGDANEREAAKDLLAKISPSSVGRYVFLLTALLLLAVTYSAYSK